MNKKGQKADLAFLSIDKFSSNDLFQYNLVIDTWVSMFEETIEGSGKILSRYISEYGLVKTIDDCAEIADRVLSGFDNRPIQSIETSRVSLHNFIVEADIPWDRKLLLLRFPKRFTWNDMSAIEKKSAAQFKQNNNRIKMLDRRGINRRLIEDLNYVVKSFLPKNLPDYKPNLFRDIPPGATADTPNCRAGKMLGVLRQDPKFLDFPLIEVAPRRERCSKLIFVPKNYKKLRGIMAEPVFTNFSATRLREQLLTILSSKKGKYHPGGRVLTKDQTRNKSLAVKASSCDLCTLDLTAASDSISFSFAYAVLPELAYQVDQLRSTECLYQGKRIPLYLFCTMGFRATFDFETLGFWACICVAHLWAETLGHEHYDLDLCSAYGDDLIVPTGLSDWLIPILEACGFKVNLQKSFTSDSSRFHESCGCDVLDGTPLITCYWPRQAIGRESIPSLVSLQNRLYETSLFPVTSQSLGDKLQKWYKIPDANLEYIPLKENRYDPELESDFKTTEVPLGIMRPVPILREFPRSSFEYYKKETVTVTLWDQPIPKFDWERQPLEQWQKRYLQFLQFSERRLNQYKYWLDEDGDMKRQFIVDTPKCWQHLPLKAQFWADMVPYKCKATGEVRFFPSDSPHVIHSEWKTRIESKRTTYHQFGTDGVELAYRNLDGKQSYYHSVNKIGNALVTEVTKAVPVFTGELPIPREWNLSMAEYRKAISVLIYQEFLFSGPKYEDKFLEMLHISAKDQLKSWTCGVKKNRFKIERSKSWTLDLWYKD